MEQTTTHTKNVANTFYMVNAQQLKEVVQSYFEELLIQLKQKEEQSKSDRLVTCDEAMDLLKCSRTTLWQWEKNGYLLPFRVGKKVNYRLSDIQRIIKGNNE